MVSQLVDNQRRFVCGHWATAKCHLIDGDVCEIAVHKSHKRRILIAI